jgi:hypothetical protein
MVTNVVAWLKWMHTGLISIDIMKSIEKEHSKCHNFMHAFHTYCEQREYMDISIRQTSSSVCILQFYA